MNSTDAYKLRATALMNLRSAFSPGQKITPEVVEKRKAAQKRYAKANQLYEKLRNAEMEGA